MDNRMRRARINAGSTLLHQLVSTACGIVIPWIMINQFGSEAYGATTSIAQFLAYITLFEGGVGRVARGALYAPLATGDEERISGIYLSVKRFFRILGIGFMGYALILAIFYYDISDVSGFTREYIFALVLAIAVGKFAEYMGGITNITLFHADQRQYVVNSVLIFTSILNVILVVVLANAGVDILWVKLVSSLVFVLKPIFFTIYLKRHYCIRKPKKQVTLENKATGIAQHMAYVIQNNTDVLILTIFADLKAVAVYSVYHLVSFSLRNITTSFTGGMEAVFGNMIAKDEQTILQQTYQKYKFLLTLLSVTLFGTACALIVPFVRLYTAGTTDANYTQPVFALLLLIAEAINCLVLPCFNLSIAANKLKESKIGAYGEAAVNLTVSLILIWWNPLIGVAIGTLASAIFKSIYYMAFAGKHILKMKISRLIRDFAVTMLVLIAISCVGMRIVFDIPFYNYWRWCVGGMVTVIVVGVFALLVGLMIYPDVVRRYFVSIRRKIKGEANEVCNTMHNVNVSNLGAYAGYVQDKDELMECSSGGVATAFARTVLRRGGYVAGVSYSDDFMEARYEIIHREEMVDRFKGSKYIDVNKGTVYRDVKTLLEAGEEVLFFGLPCVVAALYAYLKKDYKKLITVELICHGPTHPKVHRHYVEMLQKKYNSKIVEFSVKKKMGAWTPGYLYAKFENGQEFSEEFYHTEYGYAFSVSARKACYTCKFRGDNRTGDVMIGDFWGAKEEDLFWNKMGVSSILVRTEKGLSFLQDTENVQLYETTFARIVERNPNIVKPRSDKPERRKFDKLLETNDLFYAVKHSRRLRTKVKAIVKKLLGQK